MSIAVDRIILGTYSGAYEALLNTIVLIFKQRIYASKIKEEIPTFMECLRKVHIMYLDEKFIAFKNGKNVKHRQKMEALYSKLLLKILINLFVKQSLRKLCILKAIKYLKTQKKNTLQKIHLSYLIAGQEIKFILGT